MLPYYADDVVTIYHGDSREILPTIDRVDHVITDPPYAGHVFKGARSGTNSTRDSGRYLGSTVRDLEYGSIDDVDRLTFSGELARLSKRWVIVFTDAESLTAWRVALESAGLRHIRMGAWVTPAATPQFTGDRPGSGWEGIEIAHAKGRCHWNGGGRPATWIVNRPQPGSDERRASEHPTPKPEALLSKIVADFTDPGDLVLDPFLGSGTTLAACKRLGRRAIGIDLSERYCESAARRLSQGALTGLFR